MKKYIYICMYESRRITAIPGTVQKTVSITVITLKYRYILNSTIYNIIICAINMCNMYIYIRRNNCELLENCDKNWIQRVQVCITVSKLFRQLRQLRSWNLDTAKSYKGIQKGHQPGEEISGDLPRGNYKDPEARRIKV